MIRWKETLHVNESYLLLEDETRQSQDETDLSFIGGTPRLPGSLEIPLCTLCGASQTFFFQVTFPEGHVWGGLTMAVFACTSCANEDYFIPEMLQAPLHGVVIPEHFLETYQRNFRVLVFEGRDGVLRRDYGEKVKFRAWKLVPAPADAEGTKLGGRPTWYLDDETPASYGKVPMVFLLQIPEEFRFEKVAGAPPQMKLDLAGRVKPSPLPFYSLFLRNNLYFFGTQTRTDPHVYILTQI
jgi:hypothetical protein